VSESIQRHRNGGIFNFNNGSQDTIVTVNGTFAWAVFAQVTLGQVLYHLPTRGWFFGSGLLGLMTWSKKRI